MSLFERMRAAATPERVAKLRAMPYQDFLRTGYWQVLRAHVLRHKPCCERCGTRRALQVHHRTYARHGLEHEHWREDLEVLCRWCHAKHHGVPAARDDNWRAVGEIIPEAMTMIGAEGLQ